MDDGAPFELPSVDDLEVAAAAAAAALEVLAPTQETSSEEEDSSSDEEVSAMQAQSGVFDNVWHSDLMCSLHRGLNGRAAGNDVGVLASLQVGMCTRTSLNMHDHMAC
jgi:hypothetical protein